MGGWAFRSFGLRVQPRGTRGQIKKRASSESLTFSFPRDPVLPVVDLVAEGMMRGWIENLRKWIDGEEGLDEQGEPLPRSKWDDFLVAVAREIEASMQREMFTPPG